MSDVRDPGAVVRENMLDRAIEEREPRLFDLLVSAMSDEDEGVRGTAAYGLGEIGDERAVPLLVALVDTDTDETVVLHALKSLESYLDDRIHRVLLKEARRARRTRSPRWYAAKLLRRYDSASSVEALLELLADQDVLVRQVAHESLVDLRPADRTKWDRLAAEQE